MAARRSARLRTAGRGTGAGEDAVALALALAVAVALGAAVVIPPAVGLDEDPRAGEHEIDLHAATSRSVRAGLVTRMPSHVATSSGARLCARCRRRPERRRAPVPGSVTWIGAISGPRDTIRSSASGAQQRLRRARAEPATPRAPNGYAARAATVASAACSARAQSTTAIGSA